MTLLVCENLIDRINEVTLDHSSLGSTWALAHRLGKGGKNRMLWYILVLFSMFLPSLKIFPNLEKSLRTSMGSNPRFD
jgi:hypothetical protein